MTNAVPFTDFPKSADRRLDLSAVEALFTHLGCVPSFRPTPPHPDIGERWSGGFFLLRNGSKFDLAASLFKNGPAPTNLTVPPHSRGSETALLIGSDPTA